MALRATKPDRIPCQVVRGAARLLRLIGLIVAAGLAAPANAGSQFVAGGYALSGYDAAAYQTSGGPIPGDAGFILDWNGAVWRFASAANRDAFRSDPRLYGPAYDGHCAYAVSEGRKSGGVPELWYVAEGRLFLLCSKTAFETRTKEFDLRVMRADANWPALEGLPAAVPAQPVKAAP